MWGQEVFCCHQHECHRIIPTRVGTRYWWWHYTTTIKDHPHACGDKLSRPTPCRAMRGSSPRVWGQVAKLLCDLGIMRIIPTRVGTRIRSKDMIPHRWDHPHACGDKTQFCVYHSVYSSSSPRVWGQDNSAITHDTAGRIIPTRVGTRLAARQAAILI